MKPQMKNPRFYRNRLAFTLIEMILVTSLLSVTGLAVYHAIANGIKIWQYSLRYSAQEDVAVLIEKLTVDLQNTFFYSLIAWEGKPDKILFSTIIRAPADKTSPENGQILDQMGSVEYFYQKGKKTVFRRQSVYGQALKTKKKSEARALASPVESIRFTYYQIEGGKIKAKKSISNSVPFAIQIDVELKEAGGSLAHLTRMIEIPTGNANAQTNP